MRELLSGAAISFVIRFVGVFSQFGFNVLLGRWLGAGGMGLYALALAICVLVSVIGRFGMDILILRFIAMHRSPDDARVLAAGWRRALVFVLLASATMALIVFGAADYLAGQIFGKLNLAEPIRWMALSIVPFAMLNVVAESFRGLQKITMASMAQAAGVPLLALGVFGLWGLFRASVETAIVAYVVATLLVFACSLWRFLRLIPWRDSGPAPAEVREQISVKQSFPFMWIALGSVVMGLSDTSILGIFHPAREVGIYAAALRLALFISFILVAVNSILAPKIAGLFKEGEMATVELLCKRGTAIMVLGTAPVLLVFFFLPELVLGLFGEGFEHGAHALIILSAGQFINIAVGSVGIVLLMTGHAREMFHINTVAVSVNIIACFLLIPSYGMIGAAVSNMVALAIQNLVTLFVVMSRLGISTVPGLSARNKA